MLFPLGFLGTFLLNNFLKETYSSRKLELEESIENLLDKNVDLGDYVGIRFLGISLGNSKINDKKNIDSEIKAKNVYVGIMPFRSFLKQKWIVKIRPEQAEINIDKVNKISGMDITFVTNTNSDKEAKELLTLGPMKKIFLEM